ncbi:MAG: ABC transporter permease [Chloroflexi bacterium]|nr:ABC transporter permease [Chloroflexota bacterium]MCC6893961.1 ABC transporter permease [Anaerolineae bacterium]
MRKIWTIAWKDVSTSFRDRNLVLIMLAAPLAVATIIALAFGGANGSDIPINDIPVAIVNLDRGANGQNLGDIYVSAFIPPAANTSTLTSSSCALVEPEPTTADTGSAVTLQTLTEATVVADAAAAKTGVDDGTYMAAIIIPADFSQKVTIGAGKMTIEPSRVELYANSGSPIQAGIIRSVVEGITNQIATGSIALQSLFATVSEQFGIMQVATLATSPSFADNIACAFMPTLNKVVIDQQTVQGQQTNGAIPLLILFGSGQAMFFSLFTGQGGVYSVFEERKQWTLQRLVVTPTPRISILMGKMLGVLVTCILQLVFLFIALTVVGSLLNGGLVVIWGNNYLLIAAVILAAAGAATGLGTLLAGISSTPEQGQIYGSLVNVAMAVLGGAFGFQLPEVFSRFSILYWGSNAFQKLANGSGEIGLNLLVLALLGAVMFGVGFWMFDRRLDI